MFCYVNNQGKTEKIDPQGTGKQFDVEIEKHGAIANGENTDPINEQAAPKNVVTPEGKAMASKKDDKDDKKPESLSNNNPPSTSVIPPTKNDGNVEKPAEEEKEKVWVEDPPKMVKGEKITYESPDKAPSLNWMKANGIYLLKYQDGRRELWQNEELIGVDVVEGDVGRVTLWDQTTTIWLWGGYSAAYRWTEEHPDVLYSSFGNNAIDYDVCGIVQSYVPVTWETQGHWEYQTVGLS